MIRAARTTARPIDALQTARVQKTVKATMASPTSWPEPRRPGPQTGPASLAVAETAAETIVPPAIDWAGVREGVREVFLTLAATLAIGFAWAAIEMGRLEAVPAPAGASGVENRYDGGPRAER